VIGRCLTIERTAPAERLVLGRLKRAKAQKIKNKELAAALGRRESGNGLEASISHDVELTFVTEPAR
jgi:hypothetical protein